MENKTTYLDLNLYSIHTVDTDPYNNKQSLHADYTKSDYNVNGYLAVGSSTYEFRYINND